MYGAVARMRVKPGEGPALLALVDRQTHEASYRANAESPEQDRRYRELRAHLAADPEWHDGEVVHQLGLFGRV